jgi:glutathione reductase (NADPH)
LALTGPSIKGLRTPCRTLDSSGANGRWFADCRPRWPLHALTPREPLKATAKLLLFAPVMDSGLKLGMSETFDYVVIGGGSGGIASAVRAASYGARALVIESGALGGTCVNVGCVPKKVMWYGAEMAHRLADAADYGFDVTVSGFDWAALKQRRDAYVHRLNGLYEQRFERESIELIRGHGRFLGPKRVQVGERVIEASHVLVAVGGQPHVPQIPGAELGITSDGFFELEQRPQRVVVVGGGYIAVELAGIFVALGSEVTLVIRRDKPLRGFDGTLREMVTEYLEQDGVRIVRDVEPTELKRSDDGSLQLTLNDGATLDGQDEVLWAIGRGANTLNLDLAAGGVATNDNGTVKVDKFQNTNVAQTYAVGDVTGQPELTPVAIAAGRRLADRVFDGQSESYLDYSLVPTVMFSHPALGTIGLTEEQAREAHGDEVKVYTARFNPMYHAFTEHKRACAVKLVTLGEDERVIGCHAVGAGVDEMMQGFAVAMRMGATKKDFDDTIAIHPTTSEELVTLR